MRTSAGPSKTLGPAASPVGERVANQTGSAVGTRDGERAAAAANTCWISGTTPRGKATCRGSHRVARRLYEPQRPVYTERRCLDDGVMHTRLGIPAPLRERRGVHQDGAGRQLGLAGRAVSRRGRWFRSARRSKSCSPRYACVLGGLSCVKHRVTKHKNEKSVPWKGRDSTGCS